MSTVFSRRGQRLMPPPVSTATYNHDPLLYINRQSKYIERNLQTLIDAQSDGLMAGLAGPSQGDIYSNSSPTPTPSEVGSPRRPSTVPVRQPPAEKVGLRAAREGIFKSIHDLLKLREEKRDILAFRVSERKDALTEVDGFSSKAAGIEEAISSVNKRPENQHAKSLQEEARNLETDIHELETKLYEMKARHRHIVNEISQVENSVDAKLSSYKNSLSMLQSDIRKYLQNPPLEPLAFGANDSTFYSLPHKRRTLEMARDHWSGEQTELQKRQNEIDWEIAALNEGGDVWKRVIGEVSGFEGRLKAEMHRSIQGQSQLLKQDGPSGGEEDSRAKAIIEDLQDTAHRIEEQLELAEARNWRLVVCCVSAELEALREAREMLLKTFNVSEEDLWPTPQAESAKKDRHVDREGSQTDLLSPDNPEPPADLLKDSNGRAHDGQRSEDEDDEPDPAWLLPES